MKVVAFKIWSDYAHFRKHYTTSSPLTHSLPPPSALRGLVAAILGFEQTRYPALLTIDNCQFGVRLLQPVQKVRMGFNYLDTKDGAWVLFDSKHLRPKVVKDGHGTPRLHTQVRIEFLKNPCFEIYVHHQDNAVINDLVYNLQHHLAIYTPYLGVSECLANFSFSWVNDVEPFTGKGEMLSAFQTSSIQHLHIQDGLALIKESVPVFLDEQRSRKKTEEIAFNPGARKVLADIQGAFLYPGTTNQTFCFIG
jgi:CRISPR-associated protein Cas5h